MNQSKVDSLLESVCNTVVGFVTGFVTLHLIVNPLFGLATSLRQDLIINAIFTVVSIGRGYSVRRLFNGRGIWETIRCARSC